MRINTMCKNLEMMIFVILATTLLRDAEFLNIKDFQLLHKQVRFLRIYHESSLLLILQSLSPTCIATPKELNNKHTYSLHIWL